MQAQNSPNWVVLTEELQRFLQGGADRLRYAKLQKGTENLSEIQQMWQLDNPQFSLDYLIEDYRKAQITRELARQGLENMLLKGQRFIQLRMGIGKSTFIFKMLPGLCLERGIEPVLITTDDLATQLLEFVDRRAFHFKWSVNCGLPENASYEKCISHLKLTRDSLYSLKKEGRYVVTSPSQQAALRNSLIFEEDKLSMTPAGPERTKIFKKLNLLKEIQSYFKQEAVVYFQDEDVNLDNSF